MLKTIAWPVAVYGCESWTLRATDSKRLQAFEMACYRRMLKISWIEHRTNDSVLKEMGTERQILETVKRRKLQYFGHVIRAQNLCTHIPTGFVEGKPSRGRQRRRWTDDIKRRTSRVLQNARIWPEIVRAGGDGASTFHGPRPSTMRKGIDKTRQDKT